MTTKQHIPPEERLILALDLPSFDEATKWVNRLRGKIKFFKIGLQLFLNSHFRLVNIIADYGAKVFLDLKLHDIPNTVKNAIEQINNYPVEFTTVHCETGILKAAVNSAREVKIIAVTVLTSMDDNDLKLLGTSHSLENIVLNRVKLAKQIGCHGIVASGKEVARIKEVIGRDMLIIVPGIRPKTYKATDDQKRVVSPEEAIRAGADYIVIGRPILNSASPEESIEKIFEEISNNLL